MSLNKAALATVNAHAARLFPGASSRWRAETVQEAFRMALEADGAVGGERLAQQAIALLPVVARAERQRLRRGGRVVESTNAPPMPEPVRRTKRRPRMPRGLAPVVDATGAHVIPVEVGDSPDADLLVATHRLLREVLEPTLRYEPVSPTRRAAILGAYSACFGSDTGSAWASVLTDEIREGKRRLLAARDVAGRAAVTQPEASSIEFKKHGEGYERYPELPTKFATNVRRVVRWSDGTRATIDLIGEIDGETRVLGHLVVTSDEVPLPPPRATSFDEAPLVLLRTIQRLAMLAGAGVPPAYALDQALVAWLIERAGFEGGGGSKGLLTRSSLERLLVDPAVLAAEVEAFGRGHADRLDHAREKVALAEYAVMAARIRMCALNRATDKEPGGCSR